MHRKDGNIGIPLCKLDGTVINKIFYFLQIEYYTDFPIVPPHKQIVDINTLGVLSYQKCMRIQACPHVLDIFHMCNLCSSQSLGAEHMCFTHGLHSLYQPRSKQVIRSGQVADAGLFAERSAMGNFTAITVGKTLQKF